MEELQNDSWVETLRKRFNEIRDSEDYEKMIDEYFEQDSRKDAIRQKQLERFHKKTISDRCFFDLFLTRLREKYASDDYRDRHYNKGIIPPENLFFFLRTYAEAYGLPLANALGIDEKWHNYIDDSVYVVHGWAFEVVYGQGAHVNITKF